MGYNESMAKLGKAQIEALDVAKAEYDRVCRQIEAECLRVREEIDVLRAGGAALPMEHIWSVDTCAIIPAPGGTARMEIGARGYGCYFARPEGDGSGSDHLFLNGARPQPVTPGKYRIVTFLIPVEK